MADDPGRTAEPRRSAPESEPGELVPVDDAVIGRAVKVSVSIVAGIGAVVAAVLFWGRAGPEPRPDRGAERVASIEGSRSAAPAARPPAVTFRDVTIEAGIRFTHENGARGEKLLPETMGGGSAFFDYDGDGDQDLLLTNGTRWPHDPGAEPATATMALYTNDGRGRFTDDTAKAGLAVACYGMGVAVGDVDADGDVDLFVAAVGENLFFRNDGGVFRRSAADSGLAGAGDSWSSSAGFFDYDNDGDLDLFVCNYVKWSRQIDAALAFTLNGRDRAYGPPTNYEGTHCSLYRNDGSGRFEDVSAAAGLHVRQPSTGAPVGKALALALHDFDADGFQDVVVANDTVQNFLFHNQRDGTFAEIGLESGVGFDSEGAATGAMGIDACRYRDDDAVGIAIGNFANEMTSLYVSTGKLRFSDDANLEGIGAPSRLRLTFGLFFFDYDLDGRLDLLQANGHIEESIQEVQPSQRYRQPAQLFWNRGAAGGACFVAAAATGDLDRPIVGRGACYADIDGDLDLDVLLTQAGGKPLLLRNEQSLGHHALRLVLEGTRSNRDAIGARVRVRSGGRELERWVAPTRSYLSQVELPITIGLGAEPAIDELVVFWPSGTRQVVEPVEIDKSVRVTEPR